MRKIFAVVLSAAVAVVGILSIVQGIITFIKPVVSVGNFNTGIATTEILMGVISIICLIGTITALIKVWNRNKANERALFSLGIYILGEGVVFLLTWLAYKQTGGINEETMNALLAAYIITLSSGGLIFIASLEFVPVGARRLFGVLGTVVGIVAFALACIGLKGADVITWIVIIGGLVISVLGLILSVTLKDKRKKA